MMRLIAAISGFCVIFSPADAQPQCAAHDVVAQNLATQFGEVRRSMGLGQDNTVMELYAADSGTWTLTVTLRSGQTCLVAAGDHFETVPASAPAKGDPA